VAEVYITVHDVVVDYDGITFIEPNGGRVKVILNEQKQELLRKRLEENQ
jgi:DNA-binding LytR/AlgR family response regulator